MANIEKVALRKAINERRINLSKDEIANRSSVIIGKLEVLLEFLKAKTVLIYWSLPEEVHTHDFIRKWQDTKVFVLPQVANDKLVVRKLTKIEAMKKGKKLGIMEPVGEVIDDYDTINLAIVPGVAFDQDCNRLGRGGAYFDRLLQKCEKTYKVGVAFDFQLVKSIPCDDHDVKVDKVITD